MHNTAGQSSRMKYEQAAGRIEVQCVPLQLKSVKGPDCHKHNMHRLDYARIDGSTRAYLGYLEKSGDIQILKNC